MPTTVQVVHRLHGEQDDEIEVGAIFGTGQTKIQFVGAPGHRFDHLIDGVLVLARPARYAAADVLPDPRDEARLILGA